MEDQLQSNRLDNDPESDFESRNTTDAAFRHIIYYPTPPPGNISGVARFRCGSSPFMFSYKTCFCLSTAHFSVQ